MNAEQCMSEREREIEYAQGQLDFHPNRSTYWDTQAGQDVMHIAAEYKLTATNTDEERRELYRRAIAEALDEDRNHD